MVGDVESSAVLSRLAREEGVVAGLIGTVPLAGLLRPAAAGLICGDLLRQEVVMRR